MPIHCYCSDRKRKRDKGIASQSGVSGGLRFSDRIQDKVREGKLHSFGSKNSLEEQVQKNLFKLLWNSGIRVLIVVVVLFWRTSV